MLDFLITNGRIVDGTGAPPYRATVGIQGDRLTLVRGDAADLEAQRKIDAGGKVVAPGFIDFHAHSGLVMLAEPLHQPKLFQGITTEVIGVDGNSYAPFPNQEDLQRFRWLNAGLDGSPDIGYNWSTVEQYLSRFDHIASVNVAYVVGNAPLRIATVGWKKQIASSRQTQDMIALLREAMEEGAFGLSTGLDYPPGEFASTEELAALTTTVAAMGGIYHTHVRYTLGDQYLDPLKEALDICRDSGAPCHITHLYKSAAMAQRGGATEVLDLLEDASDAGMEVTFDTYPYNYSSTRLSYLLPSWTLEDGPDRLLDLLATSNGRQQIRDTYARQSAIAWDEIWLTNLSQDKNRPLDGLSIAEIARIRGSDAIEVICDLLVSEDLRPSSVSLMDQGYSRAKFISHPLSMFGTDALLLGNFPSPRTYGTFPRILSEFVREERYLTLPQAIQKMTSLPARRLGLRHRGIVEDGNFADLVIFDAQTVGTDATRQSPKREPRGIDYVFVNGRLAVEHGMHTGETAGRALRRGRD